MKTARPLIPWSNQKRDLVEKYYPLVCAVARKLSGRCPRAELDDLIQDGVFGLADAIEKFDPSKSSLGTYARRRITGAILDAIRNRDWTPRLVRKRKEQSVGMIDFPPEAFFRTDPRAHSQFDTIESRDLQTNDTALRLNPRRREVMTLMYSEGLNMEQTADRIGLSASAVSMIHKQALGRLRAQLTHRRRTTEREQRPIPQRQSG